MKLQPASRKEIKRIAIGSSICTLLLVAVMFLLSLVGAGSFDYRVIIGALGGCLVAILNFTIMCLTIQKAVNIAEKKTMKAFIQGSYNGRLLLQAGWVVAAFLISHINVIAAAIPLLFPNLVIFWLNGRGKLVSPSDRPAVPQEDMEESEDIPGPFEV